nr:M12 family metallo-peptidase [Xanthomonadales bacterium]
MRVLLLMFGLFASVMSFGQTASRDLFQPLATRPDAATSRSSRESWYRLDEPQLRWALSKLDTRGQTQPVVLWLPDPDGELRPFAVSRSEVMAPELAARFPEIETFQGQAVDGSRATLRFELSPVGFTAMAFVPGRVQLIEPDAGTGDYVSFVRERREGDAPFRCSVTGEPLGAKSMPVSTELQRYAQGLIHARPKASGPTLRTYRTAVAATVEYTATFGGSVLGAMRGIATAINRINQVYETEIGVRLVLVPNNAAVVYTVEPDPYTNNNGSTMLGENQTNLTNVIGGANYDVGHVFSTGGGGVAILG